MRVTITDEQTGVKTIVGTNGAGNFSTPPLILGTYHVDIEKTGSKLSAAPETRSPVVRPCVSMRRSISGAATESVKVEAATTRACEHRECNGPTRGWPKSITTISQRLWARTSIGSFLLQLQPGYVPMQPNGDTIPRKPVHIPHERRTDAGDQKRVDGAAFGYAEGHQQERRRARSLILRSAE